MDFKYKLKNSNKDQKNNQLLDNASIKVKFGNHVSRIK